MTDRSNRKESYLTNFKPNSDKSQENRRIQALLLQKERRQNAFDLARSNAGSLALFEDLNLMSSDSDSEPVQSEMTTEATNTTTHVPKNRKKSKKSKNFFPWAKNLLMHAEALSLKDGLLPPRLETDWSAVIAPVGKRVVVVTGFSTGANTVILVRASGRSLERRSTILPPNCILDCLYDKDINTIWVLDLIKWKGVYYVDFDFTFRSFFLSSKLSELPPQPFLPEDSTLVLSKKPPLLVLPTPRHSSPLTPEVLLSIMSTVAIPTTVPVTVLSLSSTPILSPIVIHQPFSTTGFLLFINEALYHSGPSTLAGWISNEIPGGRKGKEGLVRLRQLVQDWSLRGGPARIENQIQMEGMREEEVTMDEGGEEEMDLGE